MTGPRHFKAAELLLGQAAEVEPDSDIERYCLAAAQVHATLALTAATALAQAGGPVDYVAWDAVAGRGERQ